MVQNNLKSKILVVDDTATTINILSETLESEGFQVFVATSGDKAIARAETILPDLILLDVMMPGIDGFETCRRIKKIEKIKDIPILFMTGLTAIESKVKGFQAGAVDYVTKPIEIDEVLSRIRTHIALKNIQQELLVKNDLLQKEIQERITAEERVRELNAHLEKRVMERTIELARVNRMLKILSECNQILVRANNEDELLQSICKIIITMGGYPLTQVGFFTNRLEGKVWIAAEIGESFESSPHEITLSITELNDFANAEFFKGKPFISNQVIYDPHAPGISGPNGIKNRPTFIALPIIIEELVVGFLKIYSDNQNAFNSDEVVLLIELGDDLAFGIKSLNERKELEMAEKELRENKLMFDEVSEQSQVVVWSTDENGIFTFVSDTCKSVWGYSRDEIIGKMNYTNLIPPEDREKIISYAQKLKSQKEKINDSIFRIRKRNGDSIWVSTYAAPLLDEKNNCVGYRGSIVNVTERQKIIDELIKAKKNAEEASLLKSTLLANMSHEFRTPLNGILGFAQLLEDELKDPNDIETVKKITRSGKRLMNTLNSVLTLLDLEQKDITPHPTSFELSKICTQIFNSYFSFADEKKLKFDIDYASVDITLSTDEALLKKLISYLVENAIKYTLEGSVKIYAERETAENAAGKILIHVKDTGIGIKKEYQSVIFEEFRQVSEGIRRAFEGVGLGLTLAKKVASLIGAEITLTSNLGEGSDFIVALPLNDQGGKILHNNSDGIKNKSDFKNEKPGFKILIVEDNLLNVEVIKRFLTQIANVSYSQDGAGAIQLARQKNFDLFLIDINLGYDMDGTEVLRNLRAMDKYKSTPMIAITGYASEMSKKEFIGKGFSSYLAKPFDKRELIALVDEFLSKENT